MNRVKTILTILVLAIAPLSHSLASDIALEDAWIAEAPPGVAVLAGYVRIINNSAEPLSLDQVNSPAFRHVEMHRSVIADGMASMQRQSSLPVPAQGAVEFEPGGYHLMLFDPVESLSSGDIVKLEFLFSDNSAQLIDAEVRRLDQHGHHHHH